MTAKTAKTTKTAKTAKTAKLIIAHRGVPVYAWENTLESFEKAIELGADAIEFDVRRTQDGFYVAHHDETIEGQLLRQLTYRQLNQIALNRGFRVPTVAEILKMAQGRIRLDVELKEAGYECEIAELLLQFGSTNDFIITSFHDRVVKSLKQHYPDFQVGLLLGVKVSSNWTAIATRLSELFPGNRVTQCQADFIAPHYHLLKFGFLSRAQKANKPVFVWTVNDDARLKKYLNDDRIAGAITDRCDRALALRQS